MAFIGDTIEKKITVTGGKTFKIFLTEQVGGYWVATILYAAAGVVSTHNELGSSKEDAFTKATSWTLNNIDKNATIETL